MSRHTTLLLPPDPAGISRAVVLLRSGGLVAFPTETVYGLGGCADDPRAVARIFAAKGRPPTNPLICHVADLASARPLGLFGALAEDAAARFWPGPLTLVVPLAPGSGLAPAATAGLATVALRVPDHPVALALLRSLGRPLAAPSANPSGRLSPTTPKHVVDGLGRDIDAVLVGGRTRRGLESTVLDVSGDHPVLLRPGAIPAEALTAELGPLRSAAPGDPVAAPGQLVRHYAPGRPLRLGALRAEPGEALLAFGPHLGDSAARTVLNLSEGGDLDEAAANLFFMLHELDRPEHRAIAVMPVPEVGLGRAINDRLRRAAAAAGSDG